MKSPLVLLFSALFVAHLYGQHNVRYAKQGFSMHLCFDNRGVLGHAAYPGVIGGVDPGADSIGLEYPLGSPYEHIFGAGLWVGGKLDTARIGTSTPIRLVTAAYEGWSGPYCEFFPGPSSADSIWRVNGRGVPRPASWNNYWGNLIPPSSFSDNDHYCLYDDTHVHVANHVPLNLKVAQSSFVWADPYAEAVHIMECRIVNTGLKQIDSAYIGLFLNAYVGLYSPTYVPHNYTAYFPDIRTAYFNNPIDIGPTPVGIASLYASHPLDSLRHSFRWWPGPGFPGTDADKFRALSAGVIDSNQSSSTLGNVFGLISFGPFTIRPVGGPAPDTVTAVFGIVCGQNLTDLREHVIHARNIYQNGGVVAVRDRVNERASSFALFQNYPNPFNPRTTITYTIPVGAYNCTPLLRVFDVLGREVATLVNGFESPGLKSVVFDASSLPSGVYFYQLRSGSFVETKKLVLTK